MSRGQANLLRAFSLWTVYVWGFRIFTILGDDERSAGFKVVHSILALVSVAFAVAAWIVVARVRRASATSREDEQSVSGPVGPRRHDPERSHY
jgi:uncharacterized membrane protein